VATAIGLGVAIPAVAAFNYFQRRIKTTLGNAEALRHIVLSYLKTRGGFVAARAPGTPVATPSPRPRPLRVEGARVVVSG
jgi:biopolymer transport protein ExbB